MKIFTKNEYSQLRSVVVGSAQQSAWPIDDSAFDQSIAASTYKGTLIKGPLPVHITAEAEEDLNRLIDILEQERVRVYRPKITRPHWSYSARDILLTVGNTIIECPTQYASRVREAEL